MKNKNITKIGTFVKEHKKEIAALTLGGICCAIFYGAGERIGVKRYKNALDELTNNHFDDYLGMIIGGYQRGANKFHTVCYAPEGMVAFGDFSKDVVKHSTVDINENSKVVTGIMLFKD